MKNFKNNYRRSRYRANDSRGIHQRENGHNTISDFSHNSSFRKRNQWNNNQNASKLIEKYTSLAREALSNGDKSLSENYLQHADHFARILGDQQVIKNENTENQTNATDGNKEAIKKETLNSKEQNSSEN
tara:strand:- start:386 stop:775 length:390 start_codon:yes stop_codon:yes gene_type:complete